ncbi:MAG: hypothetical protein H7Y07_07830 [Pyrinomonadaceae bacterium]|nr:hypothetical protein [Sphingobacteriaceae bacterium]
MHTHRYLITLLLSVFSAFLLGQTPPKSTNKFSVFFEKVYIHTDRELYATGEDIWYKAYLVNAQTNQPLSSSSNLYVELISPKSNVVSRQVIRLDKSRGKGDFTLSDTLATGVYKIRAYTNWIRNFGENFVFEKSISIAQVPVAGLSAPVVSKPTRPVLSNVQTQNAQKMLTGPTIGFFPEGGSLIEGVPSRVAMKIETKDGKGVKAQGAILSSQGDTVSKFSCNASGMGSFSFKPESGLKYKALGILDGKQPFEAEMPKALLTGYAVFIQEKDSLINVMTFLNEPTLQANQDKQLLLIVKQGGKIVLSTPVAITSTQLITRISKSALPAGINAITLIDAQKRPQCERLIFIPQKEKVNISITPDKAVYQPKEKVILTIQANDATGKPLKSNLSLSVTTSDIVPENESNIQTYLLLQSELRGKIDNPKQYFDQSNADRQKQLDLLLLTQGWRDFVWKRVADSAIRITRVLEQGVTISGMAKQAGNNKPLPKANISLRTPKAQGAKFFSTQTDSLGRYFIDNLQLYGQQAIIIASRNATGEPVGRIMLDSTFSDTLRIRKPGPGFQEAEVSEEKMLMVQSLVQQRTKFKSLSDTIELGTVVIKGKRKPMTLYSGTVLMDMGYPEEDFVVTAKDNTDYRSLLHYLLHKSNYSAQSTNGTGASRIEFFGQGKGTVRPLIILNGKSLNGQTDFDSPAPAPEADGEVDPTAAPDQDLDDDIFASLTMDLIKKINIRKIAKIVPGNPPGIGYILEITTKPGALDWKQKDKIIATINGYYLSRIFYAPAYNNPSAKADSMPTVFWQPNVTTNENGEAKISYYNADPKSKISVAVEGITDKGTVIVGNGNYVVK